jgi:hypothetical protein
METLLLVKTIPVLPRNSADLENGSSRGFPIIVVEHPAQFIAAADAAQLEEARRRLDQFVLDALMIAPLAIIVSENRDDGPQMSFAQEDQATHRAMKSPERGAGLGRPKTL